MQIIDEIYKFYKDTPLEKGKIGKSLDGRDIFYIFAGSKGGLKIIAQYAIHAREWITALLAIEQIKYLARQGAGFGVYFIPIANPDGAALATQGIAAASGKRREFVQSLCKDFTLYKANARAVDLNVNFAARWGSGVSNIFYPAPENYVGTRAFSEPETRALRDFTLKIKPRATLSYHTKGEEIYWHFCQTASHRQRDYNIAKELSELTGYPLKYTFGSAGGYKDWCIQNLKIPSFTVEVGSDNLPHPIGREHLGKIFNQNKQIFFGLANTLKKG